MRAERREELVVERIAGGGVVEWKVLVAGLYVRESMRQIVAAWRKTFCLSSVGRAANKWKGVGVEGVISMI